MSEKSTERLAEELEVVADFVINHYLSDVFRAAAERLRDLEKIAEFYRIKYENERENQ